MTLPPSSTRTLAAPTLALLLLFSSSPSSPGAAAFSISRCAPQAVGPLHDVGAGIVGGHCLDRTSRRSFFVGRPMMQEDDDDGEVRFNSGNAEEESSSDDAESDTESVDDEDDGDGSQQTVSFVPSPSGASQTISDYKTSLNPTRSSFEPVNRPGATTIRPLDVTMKFGGSSLANAERVDRVTNLIKDRIRPPRDETTGEFVDRPCRPRAVICSAMGKTTNSLLAAGDMALEGTVDVEALRTLHLGTCDEFGLPDNTRTEVASLLDECEDMLNGVRLIQELSPKSLDQLVSYGERCSVRIVAARLNQIGIPARAFDSWDVGVGTDDNFGDARLSPDAMETIRAKFDTRIDPDVVAVVTGFIGKHMESNRITTLGRGGSDLTATAIGAALGVDEVQVWKDVDGILTADPRLVSQAIPVGRVSYDEASELAYFGAQVLHPIAMQPARKAGIPVRVKNSYNPAAPGTVIDNIGDPNRMVTAITCKRKIALMDISSTQMLGAYGFLGAVFNDFERHKLSVDVLASSEVSISVTLDKKQREEDIALLRKSISKFADVEVRRDRAILTLIADVGRSSDVLATVFRSFSYHGIKVEMMSQGASKVNISFVIKEEQLDEAISSLHSCFFEDKCDVGLFEGGGVLGKVETAPSP